MRVTALISFLALAFGISPPAAGAQEVLRPALAGSGSRALSTPVLGKLASTRMLYAGAGASMTGITGGVLTTIPSLTTSLRCPGPSPCYVEAEVEMQVFGTTGAMGFDLRVDGAGVDPNIGANYVFGAATPEMTARRFVVRVPPGGHSFAVAVYGNQDFSYGRHSIAYRVYKQ